jgi:hypothetical protein
VHARRRDDLSGDDPESEEDGEPEMPYPLEGKYVDENDRQRCVCFLEKPTIAPSHIRV